MDYAKLEDMAQPNVYRIQRGQVLLAHPLLEDHNFQQSVILLADHDTQGTVGFVLNDPTEYLLPDALEGSWPSLPLHVGGPVDQDSLFYVHCRPDLIPGSHSIDGFLYWGGEYDAMREALQSGQLQAGHIRFFAGYSGWSPQQLYQEIDEGSWAVIPGNTVNCLSYQADLYQTLKGHLPPDFRLWSNAPKEPHLN
ncbi:MAG TPA: transcriptional regulator [Cryomorphaceae bacterium]|nr:transcriptional regulator [Cryomorphaceae bacterium]